MVFFIWSGQTEYYFLVASQIRGRKRFNSLETKFYVTFCWLVDVCMYGQHLNRSTRCSVSILLSDVCVCVCVCMCVCVCIG